MRCVAEVRARVPELPKAKRARFVEQYQVSPYDAGVLANDLESSDDISRPLPKARKSRRTSLTGS